MKLNNKQKNFLNKTVESFTTKLDLINALYDSETVLNTCEALGKPHESLYSEIDRYVTDRWNDTKMSQYQF